MDNLEYKKIYHEIEERLGEIFQEFASSTSLLQNDERFVRTRLLLAFSLLEVICNIYNHFYNLKLTNSQLIKEWLKKYCLTNKNITYKEHKYLNMVTVIHLYNFRNSIVHAFGLPEPENNIYIAAINGEETDDNIKKIDTVYKKQTYNIAFVSADSLVQLFVNGFRIMQPEIFKDLNTANQTDLDGLERVIKEFVRRGARKIPLH